MVRLPPKVIVATLLVAVGPIVAVWGLQVAGVVDSVLLAAVLGAALSMAIYQAAAAIWERRTGSGDVLFGELMLWGWIARRRHEHRLGDAAGLLSAARDLEARDPYTHGHSRRVARYSSLIAKRMRVAKADVARIRLAAAVHDVGKLGTPKEILHKPGRLTDREFEVVKQHPAEGAAMVSILGDAELEQIVRHHHERLDGRGYPSGLKGDAIPLGARIIAVADTFDAITSARPYRRAKPHKVALDILAREAGAQLDGGAVNAFRSVYLARRPLGLWIVLSDGFEGVLAWLSATLVGQATRLAALAAGTIAIGGGALGWQSVAGASFRTPSRLSVGTASAALTHAPPVGLSSSPRSGAGQVPRSGSGQTRTTSNRFGSGSSANRSASGGSGTNGSGVPSSATNSNVGAGGAGGAGAGGSAGGSGGGGSGSGGSQGAHGVGVSLNAGSPGGTASGSVGISAGGGNGAGAAVSAGGSSGVPKVSVNASVGGKNGTSVSVSVGGLHAGLGGGHH